MHTNRKSFIICLISLIFCAIESSAQKDEKRISQEEMLEFFKSSEDIYRSFEESWEYLDKKDLRKNEDLRPYFLQLLDYNKCVKNKISKRVKNKKETNVLIWDYLSETNKAGLKDTIDKSPILQKAYEDSAKIYFTDKLLPEYYERPLSISLSIFLLHMYLKDPEAYKMLYGYWKNKVPYEGVEDLLLDFEDPDVWGEYLKRFDSRSNLSKDDYYALMTKITQIIEYDSESALNLYLRLLECKDKWSIEDNGLGGWGISYDCPYNVAIFHIYASEVNHPIIKEIQEKLGKIQGTMYTYDSPIYKLSYKELRKISDEIAKHSEEIKAAFKPYLEKIIKGDAYWKNEIPYYGK